MDKVTYTKEIDFMTAEECKNLASKVRKEEFEERLKSLRTRIERAALRGESHILAYYYECTPTHYKTLANLGYRLRLKMDEERHEPIILISWDSLYF